MAPRREALDAPNGSSLTWIFDHCLRYPGSYEIPLRAMYDLNCHPAQQPGTRSPESAFTPRNSTSTKSSRSSQDASVDPAADLRAHFITSFLRRCFTKELESVDFPQVLTALDYLKDFESRRRKEVAAALQRLNIKPEDVEDPNRSELARKYPGVLSWIEAINVKGKTVETLYTQIYLGIRRWTLINEMLLPDYNKANCIAMLNTLFPPMTDSMPTPTSQLTHQILKSQRDGFFRYITARDTQGKQVLNPIICQGAPEGHLNSWPKIHDALDKYLYLANETIDECMSVTEPIHLEGGDAQNHSTKGRKVDSGISFGSTSSSGSGSGSSEDSEKPLPQFPTLHHGGQTKTGGSTLERLAREFRKFGDGARSKNLRKMSSTSVLASRPDSQLSYAPSYAESSVFETDGPKRHRLISEATFRKKSHA
ncbi:hypothetical protein N7474_009341 [Penicillium riverlandense]|uniref:uncharacterized protein n=1 Tax=Penicillium riverlandense TaxID=1903569 RepID=UPI002547B29B|nr:uncharacterized protein N7474_009341 [Penicillium riverlandense]KAJ5808072.1 hypothetical protein N7474_009341 [Penicillium riverlandense]